MKTIVVVSAIVCVAFGLSFSSIRQLWASRPPEVLTAEVTQGRVDFVVNSSGTVRPIQSVTIGAFVSGPIAEVCVDYNSSVRTGDVLARIDSRLLKANVDRDRATLKTQQAEVARARAQLEQAVRSDDRAKKLRSGASSVLSEADREQYHYTRLQMEAQLALAEANVEQVQASLRNSETNLAFAEIHSPVDGIVIDRKCDVGQTVAAAFQTPELFIIAPNLDREIHVHASVDEADIGLVRRAQQLGRPVEFTVDAYPEVLFSGSIHEIRNSSTVEQNVVSYPVIVRAPNTGGQLMPGMTASLTFQIESVDNSVRIPASALRFAPPAALVHPDDRPATSATVTAGTSRTTAAERVAATDAARQRRIWKLEGTWLRPINVQIGINDGQWVQCVSGPLAVGDRVVVHTKQKRQPFP